MDETTINLKLDTSSREKFSELLEQVFEGVFSLVDEPDNLINIIASDLDCDPATGAFELSVSLEFSESLLALFPALGARDVN